VKRSTGGVGIGHFVMAITVAAHLDALLGACKKLSSPHFISTS